GLRLLLIVLIVKTIGCRISARRRGEPFPSGIQRLQLLVEPRNSSKKPPADLLAKLRYRLCLRPLFGCFLINRIFYETGRMIIEARNLSCLLENEPDSTDLIGDVKVFKKLLPRHSDVGVYFRRHSFVFRDFGSGSWFRAHAFG